MRTTRRGLLTAAPLAAGAAAAGLAPALQTKEAAPLPVLAAADAIERSPGLPLLAAERTPLHAFLRVRAGLPDHAFNAWLEHGLWLAERFKRAGAAPI